MAKKVMKRGITHANNKGRNTPPGLRTFDIILNDMLWPGSGLTPPEDKRQNAIADVLSRIPENDYRRLADMIDGFSWFIPPVWKRASCELFPVTNIELPNGNKGLRAKMARVIYLSPTLEQTPQDVLTAIVAHELAHIILKHNMFTATEKQYDAQEEEADRRICEWGFKQEHLRHKQNKRRRGLK